MTTLVAVRIKLIDRRGQVDYSTLMVDPDVVFPPGVPAVPDDIYWLGSKYLFASRGEGWMPIYMEEIQP